MSKRSLKTRILEYIDNEGPIEIIGYAISIAVVVAFIGYAIYGGIKGAKDRKLVRQEYYNRFGVEHDTSHGEFDLIGFTDSYSSSTKGVFVMILGTGGGSAKSSTNSYYRVMFKDRMGYINQIDIPTKICKLSYGKQAKVSVAPADLSRINKGIYSPNSASGWFYLTIPEGSIRYDNTFDGK